MLEYTDAPDPTIKANEVLVEVKACALNHLDVWARGGLPGIEIPLPHILGNDIAGVVREVGSLVSWVHAGDEVMLQPGVSCGHCAECLAGRDNLCRDYDILGYRRDGGYAELVAAPGSKCDSETEESELGRSCGLAARDRHRVAHAGDAREVQPGEDVLIHAAGSGVGSIGIQIAKLRGARVIATASSDEKLAKAKELGADEVVNYTQRRLAEGSQATDKSERSGRGL